MLGITHAAGGMFVGTMIGAAFKEPLIGAAIGAVAGLLPDIDHPNSLVSQRIPILPVLMNIVFGHRGLTHTIWFCFLIAGMIACIAFFVSGWAYTHFGLYVFGGMLSHLVLDGVTKSGVKPFAPLAVCSWKGFVTTGDSWIEVPLTILFVILSLKIGSAL